MPVLILIRVNCLATMLQIIFLNFLNMSFLHSLKSAIYLNVKVKLKTLLKQWLKHEGNSCFKLTSMLVFLLFITFNSLIIQRGCVCSRVRLDTVNGHGD